MTQTRRIAVLLTCFNRAVLTDQSLTGLAELFQGRADTEATTFVVDDGSTDDTSTRVRRSHPGVRLARGSGDLYWAGGMREAFRMSAELGRFDGYLMVNDDVELNIEAASQMLDTWLQVLDGKSILIGSTQSSDRTEVTYSGFNERSRLRLMDFVSVPPVVGSLVTCDTFNANFVLVPGAFFYDRGGLDAAYSHGLADLDLGLDAGKAGIGALIFDEPIGVCDRGPTTEEMLLRRRRMARARLLFVHPYNLKPELYFAWKHRPRVLLLAYALKGVAKRVVLCARPRKVR